MDAIQLLLVWILTVCQPAGLERTQQAGETYQLHTYTCGAAHQLVTWERRCLNTENGAEYWTRPFLLVDEQGAGLYLNQFAEVQSGRHLAMDALYYPACAS